MRFEVRNPVGAPHEVELLGTIATLGRDPTCDLVLNDPKCSRRHAVIEAGPDGMIIRDSGSANGIYVNGRKTERAPINDGDVLKLGDVSITVLGEDVPGTLVMGPEDVAELAGAASPEDTRPDSPPLVRPVGLPTAAARLPAGPSDRTVKPDLGDTASGPARFAATAPPAKGPGPSRPVPPPAHARAAAPAPPGANPLAPRPTIIEPRAGAAPAAPPTNTLERPRPPGLARSPARPPTVTVLAVLWALSVAVFPLAGFLAGRGRDSTSLGVLALSLVLAVFSAVMSWGLFTLAPWARFAQIAVAGLGTILCLQPFSVASAVALAYMLRPAARAPFTGEPAPETASSASTETIFAAGLVAAVVLGVLITAALTYFARNAYAPQA